MLRGIAIASALAAAVSQRAEYTFSNGDGVKDFVWYTTKEGCELNSKETIAGGWAHDTGPLGLGSAVTRGPFARCQCAMGNQLSDGLFKAVTMCKAEDGGIEISVYTGKTCEGSPDEKGKIAPAFVKSFLEGNCQALTTLWSDAYLDRIVRLEDGVPVECACGSGAEAGNDDTPAPGTAAPTPTPMPEDEGTTGAGAGGGADEEEEDAGAGGAGAVGGSGAIKDAAGRRSAPAAVLAAVVAVAAAAARP